MVHRENERTDILPRHFTALQGHQYVKLGTVRKDGTSATRPVWFAQDGDIVYLYTGEHSAKVKQMRRTPQVTLQPCDARGNPLSDEMMAGRARVMSPEDPGWELARRAFNRKYGLLKRVFGLLSLLRRQRPVYIVVAPQ